MLFASFGSVTQERYKREYTIDQELQTHAWRSAGERCCICISDRRTDVMAAILKVWRYVRKPTRPIDAYLLEEQSCQI